MKRILLFSLIIVLSQSLFSQNLEIRGQIIDTLKNPIEGVSVVVKGTNDVTISDASGSYKIEVGRNAVLVFSLEGFETKEVAVQPTDLVIDVTLASMQNIFDLSLEELMNLEVQTASKVKQTINETPAATYVVTEQMIAAHGYDNLEEILHDLPGFDFNKSYGVNYSTIFMRGYRSDNSDRFLLMFDGIPENDIWKQTTWISRQYPVSDIKQIEVVYGPASALYGTNAFSGIINVITKKGAEVGKLNAIVTGGSWGRKNIEVSTGHQISKNIAFNITAKYYGASDLHPWDYFDGIGQNSDISNFSQSYIDNIGADKAFYMIEGQKVPISLNDALPYHDYSVHANLQVGNFTFTALNWTKKELEGYFYSPFKRRGQYAQWYENNQAYSLSHNANIGKKITLSSSLIYRNHRILNSQEVGHKYYTAPLSDTTNIDYVMSQSIVTNDPSTFQLKPREVVLANGDTTFVTGIVDWGNLSVWDASLEEQLTYNVNDKLNFIFGGKFIYTDTQEDYQFGHYLSEMSVSPRHIKKTVASYGQIIYKPITFLSLTAGGRYETQFDENNVNLYNIFVPRAAVLFNVSNGIVFRVQYAQAFQSPDDWHTFATDKDIRPAPSLTLNPEKLETYEVGTNIKIGSNFYFSAAVYHSVITNLIGEVDNTPANPYMGYDYGYHFENVSSESPIYGYETSFTTQITKNLYLNGNISGAWNYGVAEKMEKDADGIYQPVLDGEGNPVMDNKVLIGDIAPVKAYFGILYNFNKMISFAPKVSYVSAKNTINWRQNPDIYPIYTEIKGYTLVGMNINIMDMFGFVKGLDIHIKMDNITNQEYYNPGPRSANGTKYNARVLQPGFNFMAGLSYSLR